MMPAHELILGGARSGKSRLAEARASAWLAAASVRSATLVATALPADNEMAARIQRLRLDRLKRVPSLATVEAPVLLPAALHQQAAPDRLLVVDCLTLWTTQCLLPPTGRRVWNEDEWHGEEQALLQALDSVASPVVLVSNEIGLGVVPVSREARRCVDALGRLHQQVAERCARVTLVLAGCPVSVKEPW